MVDERGDSGFVYVDRGPGFDYLQVEPAEHAALIAAAPDLLAACKDALHGLRMDAAHREEIETLEAAIAKAEGR